MMHRFLSSRFSASEATISRAIKKGVESEMLVQIRSGLFLNRMSVPAPSIEEAAQHLRAGAIVSLQTVLGHAGVLNNYTGEYVTAIIPSGGGSINTTGGDVKTPCGVFSFKRLRGDILFAGRIEDRLSDTHGWYLRATPEKALVDWIALVDSGQSTLTRVPVHDLDFSSLDMDRLRRLAAAAKIDEPLAKLLDSAFDADREEGRQSNEFSLSF